MKEKIGNHGGMKLKANEWNDCVKVGDKGEKFVKENFLKIFLPIFDKFLLANRVKYNLNNPISIEKQLAGIDGTLFQKYLDYEVKTRQYFAYRYGDILLETISIIELSKIGWIIYSEADVVVYLWLNKLGILPCDGYLLLLNNIRKYFEIKTKSRKQKFRIQDIGNLIQYPIKDARSERGEKIWHTRNRATLIEDFPENCIIQISENIFETEIEKSYFNKWFREEKSDSVELIEKSFQKTIEYYKENLSQNKEV